MTSNEPSKRFNCRKCGVTVWWDTNRNGKRYLAQNHKWEGDHGGRKSIKAPHYCNELMIEVHTAELAAQAARLVAAVESGEIVKGQTVQVFKGRKVAKGTAGIVFWVAPEPDNYGVTKVGFTTAAGEKHFTNIENVKVQTAQPTGATK